MYWAGNAVIRAGTINGHVHATTTVADPYFATSLVREKWGCPVNPYLPDGLKHATNGPQTCHKWLGMLVFTGGRERVRRHRGQRRGRRTSRARRRRWWCDDSSMALPNSIAGILGANAVHSVCRCLWLIIIITNHLRPGLLEENPVAIVERLPLTRCSCHFLSTPASAATIAITPITTTSAAATISPSTLTRNTLAC